MGKRKKLQSPDEAIGKLKERKKERKESKEIKVKVENIKEKEVEEKKEMSKEKVIVGHRQREIRVSAKMEMRDVINACKIAIMESSEVTMSAMGRAMITIINVANIVVRDSNGNVEIGDVLISELKFDDEERPRNVSRLQVTLKAA